MEESSKLERFTKCCCCIPQRVLISLLGFLCVVNAYTTRICISMAMPSLAAPLNRTHVAPEAVCPKDPDDLHESVTGIYPWSQALQGYIIASFFLGYIVSHVPGGLCADKYGAKWTLGVGMILNSLGTLLTPFVIIKFGPYALIVTRIIIGLGQGVVFPALTVILANWVPHKERSFLGSLVLGGGQIGSILSLSMSGLMIDVWNWQVVFYVFGICSLLWCVSFLTLCYDVPQEHPCIRKGELEYLRNELDYESRADKKTPWKAIFTSAPVYAMIFAQIGHDWGLFIMISDLPLYMAQVMQFNILSNGLYSSLPYLLMWIASLVSGAIADILLKRQVISVTALRKIFTGVAAIGPGLFMVFASYAKCNHVLVVVLFTVSMGLMGPFYCGVKLTPIEMAPNFSGILSALTNGLGALAGVFAPSIAGHMTTNSTIAEWRLVFWLAFVVLTVTSIIFFIWGTSERQPFNDYSKKPGNTDKN